MLHTRIKKWKIGRNHKSNEMRTAAKRLAEYQERQGQHVRQSSHATANATGKRITMPNFMIRGEIVSYKEFLRYFRRKKINDPISWVNEQKNDDFILSDDVELVTATDAALADSSSCDDEVEVVSNREHVAEMQTEHDEQLPWADVRDPSDV